MMVGFYEDHAGDVYRLYNLKTRRIITSRDVRWLGKMYHDYVSSERSGSRYDELNREFDESDEESDDENNEFDYGSNDGTTNSRREAYPRRAIQPPRR